MHNKRVFFCLASFLIFSIWSCASTYPGLRKLTYDELYERALYITLDPENVVYRNDKNKIVNLIELKQYSRDSFALDKYVDKTDSVRLCVIRPIKNSDVQIRKKINKLYEENVEYKIKYINLTVKDTVLRNNILSVIYQSMPIKPIKINCDSVKIILKEILVSDQNNRSENQIDERIDRKNQIQVVSILEGCGFPENSIDNKESIYSIFMVIQHANADLRIKYFPLFKRYAIQGVLERKHLALMEDRILMDQGEKQKFGSQVRMVESSGKYELYPVDDPTSIDIRRSEIGLEPIQVYLSRFNISWAEYVEKLNNVKN